MNMDNATIFAETISHYLAPIRAYLDDPTVTEVMINRFCEIYIERGGKIEKIPAQFADEEAYDAAINNILQFTGKSLSDQAPLVDTRLPDGSRVHVAKTPCARFGTAVTIRKFSKSTLDMDKLVEIGSLTKRAREYLSIAVHAEQNLLVAGGTSSGKTSLLNAMSAFIPAGERIVVIEDSAELQLRQEHVISLEARQPDRYGRGQVTIRDLFRASLRLRPDRIVIGEVRGGEALDMIQAMTSGHGGSMGTLHANSPSDALNRLETMAMMSKVDLPLHALRAQIASAIDLVVQMSRHLGGKRMVTQISEIEPVNEHGQYQLRDIFMTMPVRDQKGRKALQLSWTGIRSSMAGRLRPAEMRLATELTKELFTA
ncbi:MAG: CpaF family protein [Phycisphaeraceae bacterium]|nr:CpaF family protein [Phycisphaeraceae bacterium]